MTFISLIKANPISSLKTFCVCLGFMSIGFQAGILGPALLDLKILTASDNLASVTWIVTGRGIGFALGAPIAGGLEPYVNLQLLIAIALVSSGIMYLIVPLTGLLGLSIACGSLAGVAQGIIETCSNVLMLRMWSSDCPPFLQAVFSSYGIGSLVGPLIVRPFLVIKEEMSNSSALDMTSLNNTTNSTDYSRCEKLIDGHCPQDVRLVGPFLVTVCFPIALACGFIYLYIVHPFSLRRDEAPSSVAKTHPDIKMIRSISVLSHHSIPTTSQGAQRNDTWTLPKASVFICVSLFAMFLTGVQQVIGTYIPAFGVGSDLQMDKHTAAAISSLFWAFLTAFQLVSIPVTALIGVEWAMVANVVNAVIAGIIFIIWSSNQVIFIMSCAYLGISFASSWGALFAFLEARFDLSGFMVASLTVSACVGQSLAVAIIGVLIDDHPFSFPAFILISNIIMFFLATATYFTCKKLFPPKIVS